MQIIKEVKHNVRVLLPYLLDIDTVIVLDHIITGDAFLARQTNKPFNSSPKSEN